MDAGVVSGLLQLATQGRLSRREDSSLGKRREQKASHREPPTPFFSNLLEPRADRQTSRRRQEPARAAEPDEPVTDRAPSRIPTVKKAAAAAAGAARGPRTASLNPRRRRRAPRPLRPDE